jgi:uncharacterized protein with PhoU and TrkA domain
MKMYFYEVKDKGELIYDLIFSEKLEYKIDIAEYVNDIYQYDDFVDEIKIILKKSGVKIVKSIVVVDSKTAIWQLKLKK